MKVASIMEDLIVRSTSGLDNRPTGNCLIRFGTVYVGTISGRGNEDAEMLTRRKVDLCCLQETRWREGSARLVKEKYSIYKFFWSGNQWIFWDNAGRM